MNHSENIVSRNNGFMPTGSPNSCESFNLGGDDEEAFNRYLKSNPIWEYKDIPIEYKYNSNGHRCVNLDELQDDYILFLGCSNTFGFGLKLEHTYPWLVANNFNKTYYNLGISGSGIDILYLNLCTFLSKMHNKLPEIVVLQWPNIERFFIIDPDNYSTQFIFPNKESDNKKLHNMVQDIIRPSIEYAIAANKSNMYKDLALIMLKNYGIKKIVEFNIDGYEYLDRARDLQHYGIKSHQLFAKHVIKFIDNISSE